MPPTHAHIILFCIEVSSFVFVCFFHLFVNIFRWSLFCVRSRMLCFMHTHNKQHLLFGVLHLILFFSFIFFVNNFSSSSWVWYFYCVYLYFFFIVGRCVSVLVFLFSFRMYSASSIVYLYIVLKCRLILFFTLLYAWYWNSVLKCFGIFYVDFDAVARFSSSACADQKARSVCVSTLFRTQRLLCRFFCYCFWDFLYIVIDVYAPFVGYCP